MNVDSAFSKLIGSYVCLTHIQVYRLYVCACYFRWGKWRAYRAMMRASLCVLNNNISIPAVVTNFLLN